ncbi:phosphatidylglycerol lysyltransferase domain-containing protein [Aliiroseovarius sp. F20344]|uniref:phosphatidylglycerol lysyltransferase domain-containing protein n=1 Tax=Aliiroseovarius sp. F20344 TaxID=2926414 RepID=UPI001FF224CD|nr:phosphatidylglycerol lysyltransferase domain-containing protein [Aliiroseovarius sp. F20344]MCK0143518.1 phosphatidylglycerol lysyltransferase domain-containing protein [Aliiroseovarius sp. F20344]
MDDSSLNGRKRGFATALARSAESGLDLRRMALRQLLPFGLTLGLVILLWQRIEGLDVAYIYASLKTVSLSQWFGAAVFSTISFWALGRYDGVVHRLIGTGVSIKAAERSGITSIALSQTVGLGVVSSAFVRWRMLPDLSLIQAVRISAIVAVSFLSAWAVVAALIVLTVPMTTPWADWIAWLVLAVAGMFSALSVLRPSFMMALHIPPLKAMGAFLALALIDTAAAGIALWMVMPEGCDVALLPLIAAYLLALGAGLISSAPGGMGAFELTLLALLPTLEAEPLLAAILAFRTIYYAVPAVLAALVVIRGPNKRRLAAGPHEGAKLRPIKSAPTLPPHIAKTITDAPRAEAGLLRQGRLSLITSDQGVAAAMGASSGQSLLVLSDPLAQKLDHTSLLRSLKALANQSFLSPFLYKAGGRWAVAARHAGWQVLPIAREGWIDPTGFTLSGSDKRQLRRKLRQAETAGIEIREAGADLPLPQMQRIADNWCSLRGGERGFSMGQWHPDHLPHARVYLARQNHDVIGFLTLHENASEQALDLMRMCADAPDGTMHALLVFAIAQAGREGCTRLSLAAVPLEGQMDEPWLFHRARLKLDQITGAAGLRQFKTSFAPRWETLYAAAPSRIALALGALDVTREICRKAEAGVLSKHR